MEMQMKNKEDRWNKIALLPDELVLSSILSHLSFKQVAQTSVVSRDWLRYWRHITILTFSNPSVIKEMSSTEIICQSYPVYYRIITQKRKRFIDWVNGILSKHNGKFIDELSVTFFLEKCSKAAVDEWVVWSFRKKVKKLELDFTRPWASSCPPFDPEKNQYVLHKPILDHCYTSFGVRPVLTSLCLKSVNVSNVFIRMLFNSCGDVLEELRVQKSEYLSRIESDASVSLRCLSVIDCDSLEVIDVDAPLLETFTYACMRAELKSIYARNAVCLSRVSLSVMDEDKLLLGLSSLSNCFSHLVDLTLDWQFIRETDMERIVDYLPVLGKLKHLKMYVRGFKDRNLSGWIPFLQSCPLLEKLTLKLHLWLRPPPPPPSKNDIECFNHQLTNLKTFEIMDFNGINVDVYIARFVFHNAPALEEVIFHGPHDVNINGGMRYLKLKLPLGVKIVRCNG